MEHVHKMCSQFNYACVCLVEYADSTLTNWAEIRRRRLVGMHECSELRSIRTDYATKLLSFVSSDDVNWIGDNRRQSAGILNSLNSFSSAELYYIIIIIIIFHLGKSSRGERQKLILGIIIIIINWPVAIYTVGIWVNLRLAQDDASRRSSV